VLPWCPPILPITEPPPETWISKSSKLPPWYVPQVATIAELILIKEAEVAVEVPLPTNDTVSDISAKEASNPEMRTVLAPAPAAASSESFETISSVAAVDKKL